VSAALWLYRTLLYGLLPVAAPALLLRDRASGKARPPLADRLARTLPAIEPGGVWLHAVSVGEVEIARRLVEEIEARAPQTPILVSATTATGLGLARRTLAGRAVVHPSPLDMVGPVGRLLDHTRPRVVAIVETELWPELLHQARRRGIPTVVVNGRLSEGSFARYRRVRPVLARLLAPLDRVLARSGADAERFVALGVPEAKVEVTGNVKYDLRPARQALSWVGAATALAAGRPVVVAGSTMEGEEAAVLDALAGRGAFVVLAPRHPERFEAVARELDDRGVSWLRRSRLGVSSAAADLLMLDTIGELGRAFQLARVAFIGGSLVPTGGHNPLEPAAWRVPVLTGPHIHNFREVYADLLDAGGARVVHDAGELGAAVEVWLADPAAARAAGEAAFSVLESNRGAAGRSAETMLTLAGRDG
jgi:3-deoxy-D-manno-octulosonic-acid transferase